MQPPLPPEPVAAACRPAAVQGSRPETVGGGSTNRHVGQQGERQLRGAAIVAALRANPSPSNEVALRQQLVEVFMPMATSIALRYRTRGENLEDLIQSACLGLVKASRGFDPSLGLDFEPYATKTISGEVKRHFRDQTWQLRPPRRLQELRIDVARADAELTQELGRSPRASEVAARLGVSVDDVAQSLATSAGYRMHSLDALVNDHDDATTLTLSDVLANGEDVMELVDNLLSLQTALDQLPDRMRTILVLRHWHELTQQEIGQRLGVTQMQVSRLLTKAHSYLRRQLLHDQPPQPDRATAGAPDSAEVTTGSHHRRRTA